jgi:isopentenyl-diphosphate delta-isomerase
MGQDGTARRKDAHLDLCASAEVEPRENSALFDCVHLVHCAMPEMSVADVSLKAELWGKTLQFPLMVTGMTGGTDRAEAVNRDLASLAEKYGLGFGVGSQRAMAEDASCAKSFQVRAQAPTALLVGNIGLRQAAAMGKDGVRRLRDAIGADGMALHLNVGQELTQPEGDRDFQDGYATVKALVAALEGRLLVKETGCGISPEVARRLFEMGVRAVDVSGLGGTSWVKVEQLRAQGVAAQVGAEFSGWGIPTAAAVASVRKAVGPSVRVVASGGVRTGLDVAKCLALGADLAGMALPLFRAQQEGGLDGAERALQAVLQGLTKAMVLTGSRTPQALQKAPKVITQELQTWLQSL